MNCIFTKIGYKSHQYLDFTEYANPRNEGYHPHMLLVVMMVVVGNVTLLIIDIERKIMQSYQDDEKIGISSQSVTSFLV